MSIRAIRGATQLSANTPEAIATGVKELILAILDANSLTPNDVVSVFFTSTPDLTAAFPAAACREIGFASVPLIGSVEVTCLGLYPWLSGRCCMWRARRAMKRSLISIYTGQLPCAEI